MGVVWRDMNNYLNKPCFSSQKHISERVCGLISWALGRPGTEHLIPKPAPCPLIFGLFNGPFSASGCLTWRVLWWGDLQHITQTKSVNFFPATNRWIRWCWKKWFEHNEPENQKKTLDTQLPLFIRCLVTMTNSTRSWHIPIICLVKVSRYIPSICLVV